MEKRLQIAVARLRGMRNSLQPIHRLPPELLSRIFGETQVRLSSFIPHPTTDEASTLDWRDWLYSLQVCRHWRGVMASSPALWSTICSSTIPLEFLRRSRGADLTVYLGVRCREFPPSLMAALAPHAWRFKEFHLVAEGEEDILKLQLFSSPAPRLTSLMIDVAREGRKVITSTLPPIFAGCMPKLRELALGYFTAWPKGYFHNLTHLLLHNQKEDSWPSSSEFMDFLEFSPRLEELALIRGGPMRPPGTDIAQSLSRCIRLKHLRQISIGEWPSGLIIARFLSRLTLPRKTEMYIWGNIFRDQEDVGSLLPADTSRLHNLKGIKEWYFIRQKWYFTGVPDPAYTTFQLIAVVDSTLYMTGDFRESQISPSALSRFPLNKVKSLKLREDSTQFRRLRISEWKAILRLVPALQAATILAQGSPQCTRAIISALRPPKPSPPLISLGDTVCPALKTIDFLDEYDLPFAHFCAIVGERVTRGAPKIDFTFRGGSRPPPPAWPGWGSVRDSDIESDPGFDAMTPGTHTHSVQYQKFEGTFVTVPPAWPTRAFKWWWWIAGEPQLP